MYGGEILEELASSLVSFDGEKDFGSDGGGTVC